MADEDLRALVEGPFDFRIAKARLREYMLAAQKGSPGNLALFWKMNTGGSCEDRIAAWQQVRDAGLLPRSAANYLILQNVEDAAEDRAWNHPDALPFRERIEAIRHEAGINPNDFEAFEHWSDHEAPPEYARCWDEIAELEHRIVVRLLRAAGETELAELIERDEDAYSADREVGRRFFDL